MRKSVARFANEMERIMKQNEFRPEWKYIPVEELIVKLHEEIAEFTRAHLENTDPAKELVDIANFCMMLYTRIKPPNLLEEMEEDNGN